MSKGISWFSSEKSSRILPFVLGSMAGGQWTGIGSPKTNDESAPDGLFTNAHTTCSLKSILADSNLLLAIVTIYRSSIGPVTWVSQSEAYNYFQT